MLSELPSFGQPNVIHAMPATASMDVYSMKPRVSIRAEPSPVNPVTRDYLEMAVDEPVVRVPLPRKPRISFVELPAEIHECILDHLFGARASTFSSATSSSPIPQGWNHLLRHPRRRQLSNLALVDPTWRHLVQERLYRHIKLQGTTPEFRDAEEWFLLHPHLQPHVRHFEVWLPVWEKKSGAAYDLAVNHLVQARAEMPSIIQTVVDARTTSFEELTDLNTIYQLSSQKVCLEDIWLLTNLLFENACILTIEGGHGKKPPMATYFRNPPVEKSEPPSLPVLKSVQTIILKGAWNVMRDSNHYKILAKSLPNLREWHSIYSKPKSGGYLTSAAILADLPVTLAHLNLFLEGFYSKDATSPNMWGKVYPETHICSRLAQVLPQLETLTYTGRICACFFTDACEVLQKSGVQSKLKVLDVVVKNCCRPKSVWDDRTGISNLPFIKCFVALVTAGVRSLGIMKSLQHLRIRFIDLDSPAPLLNPYFHMQGDTVTGLWTDEIVGILANTRPSAQYVELSDGLNAAGLDKDGHLLEASIPRRRPLAINASSYAALAVGAQF